MERTLNFDLVRRFPRGPVVSARGAWPLDGERVTVLFGPSGSGKTTVLRALAGLDRPDEGRIVFEGETWFDAGRGIHVPPQRRHVGLLFQDYALFPHLSVRANVGYGLHSVPKAERDGRIDELAGRFGIADLLGRKPGELSGGQRQRVALARAIAPGPRLLLLDEPLSALDGPTRESLRGELRELLVRTGVPAVVVTHDRLEALALGDRMAVLVGGSIRQVGPVPQVFTNPVDAEVARAVGTENVLPAKVTRSEMGLLVLEAGGAEILAVDPGSAGDEVYACIRAEDVVLESLERHGSSARNRLEGTVVSRQEEGALVRVRVACGPTLVVLVTRESADRMGLAPGLRVVAVVKAPGVRVVAR
ncbi:MAG: ABC transporter ATP-binding protein [Deltaproteobacteria bacterium]